MVMAAYPNTTKMRFVELIFLLGGLFFLDLNLHERT